MRHSSELSQIHVDLFLQSRLSLWITTFLKVTVRGKIMVNTQNKCPSHWVSNPGNGFARSNKGQFFLQHLKLQFNLDVGGPWNFFHWPFAGNAVWTEICQMDINPAEKKTRSAQSWFVPWLSDFVSSVNSIFGNEHFGWIGHWTNSFFNSGKAKLHMRLFSVVSWPV